MYFFVCVCLDDALEQNHCLFEEYKDPCRAGPGKEKPWVIGWLHFSTLKCWGQWFESVVVQYDVLANRQEQHQAGNQSEVEMWILFEP